jgi:hypothetical protein
VSSGGSEEREALGVDFPGDSVLADVRVFRSARPDEFEDAEEWCEAEVAVWLVRARMDRRGEVPAIARQWPQGRFDRESGADKYNSAVESNASRVSLM